MTWLVVLETKVIVLSVKKAYEYTAVDSIGIMTYWIANRSDDIWQPEAAILFPVDNFRQRFD